jgi:ABC-type transport system involved in cytochrome bd biosynthesis fused ATPase/permease subunit
VTARRPSLAVRLLVAAVLALATGLLSIWWLGTSWWSVTIAAVSAVATYVLSIRHPKVKP